MNEVRGRSAREQNLNSAAAEDERTRTWSLDDPRCGGQEAIAIAAQLSGPGQLPIDRKSTRLNSSHTVISYAVFCLKKKKRKREKPLTLDVRPWRAPYGQSLLLSST